MRLPSRIAPCIACSRNTAIRCEGCWKPLCDRKHKRGHSHSLFLLRPVSV